MTSKPLAPFPFDAVRDLLGICRAMALATPLGNLGRRTRLREIGDALVQALAVAHRFQHAPGGWGSFAAYAAAQDATRRLGDEIGALLPIASLRGDEALRAAESRTAYGGRRRSG